MPGTTTRGYPYLLSTEAPDIAGGLQSLATAIDSDVTDNLGGYLAEATSTAPVTLAGTTAVAGSASVTVVLAQSTRVKISVQARYKPATAVASRCQVQAGYNTGSSAVIGSFAGVGLAGDAASSTAQWNSAYPDGTHLLAAGTYTFYASVTRVSGTGDPTDTVDNFHVLVEGIGAV